MPRYHFKLVDSRIVSDYGTHELSNDTVAAREAIKVARSVRAARPELAGQSYSISVTDEHGAGVCVIPLDDI